MDDVPDELNIGDKVFCANCGRSFDTELDICPHCGSKKQMKKSILWCDKE